MSTYSSDYQRILKELREMRKRLARREQSDLKRFKDSNPDSSPAINEITRLLLIGSKRSRTSSGNPLVSNLER